MNKKHFILINPTVRYNALEAIQLAPEGYAVDISEPKRSGAQNRHFHALCGDIAKAGIEWAGKRRTADEWKVLLVSGHAVATKQEAEIIPGLEGEFINIRESTARMGVKRAASLLEYTLAFALSQGVELIDARRGGFEEAA